MKKIMLVCLLLGISMSFSACSSGQNDGDNKNSSVEQGSDQQMQEMEKKLEEEGVEFPKSINYGIVRLNRKKGVDYDYFEMVFNFVKGEIFKITLQLKWDVDGENKDPLYYKVSNGRIVEDSTMNSDIDEFAEVLDSLGYSDKELVSFVQWYYETNKK